MSPYKHRKELRSREIDRRELEVEESHVPREILGDKVNSYDGHLESPLNFLSGKYQSFETEVQYPTILVIIQDMEKE